MGGAELITTSPPEPTAGNIDNNDKLVGPQTLLTVP